MEGCRTLERVGPGLEHPRQVAARRRVRREPILVEAAAWRPVREWTASAFPQEIRDLDVQIPDLFLRVVEVR